MSSYILSIDQGTTGSTVALMSDQAKVEVKVTVDFPQIFPKPGWVEHDPEEIWKSVLEGIKKVLAKKPEAQIAAIGITNQRETVVMWDPKTGKPVYNAIVWQCRRTSERCQKLKADQKWIRKKTGLVIDPYFSSTKIEWLLQHTPNKNVICGTIDSFLLWRLTKGKSHKTDVSNASRTQLMNLNQLDWDQELLKKFKVPLGILPEIVSSSGEFGKVVGIEGIQDGTPICGMAGDQQAALFGQACFSQGDTKCTFGTGSFLLMNTGSKPQFSKNGLLTTVAWRLNKQKAVYALEGGAFICGAAVQFLRDQIHLFSKSADIEKLASEVKDSGGVEFVPALTGLSAPYWNPQARGLICGLTRGTTIPHLARATLEAMALQNAEILYCMQDDTKKKIKNLRVDGGAASNNLLMQIQSDYLGRSLDRPHVIETTVAGAAFLAGLGVGLWSDQKSIQWQKDKTFTPQINKKSREERMLKWKKAVSRSI